MINQTHIVIDLETMGIGTHAAIVAIGAARIEQGQIRAEFYRRVDLDSSITNGGTTDASTLSWWLKQSAEARAEVDGSQDSAPIISALSELAEFITARPRSRVWGNGATFDLRILGEAYGDAWMNRPWDFRLERDLRTLLELYPEAKQAGEFAGIRHHALHDARHEARQLCSALRCHAERHADAARLDWLADIDNCNGQVVLPTCCVLNNPDSLRGAIDSARALTAGAEVLA